MNLPVAFLSPKLTVKSIVTGHTQLMCPAAADTAQSNSAGRARNNASGPLKVTTDQNGCAGSARFRFAFAARS